MEKTLEKLISNNNRGLFLLDPPTGFGKTTAVVDLIKRFLKGEPLPPTKKAGQTYVLNDATNNKSGKKLNNLPTEPLKSGFFS